MEPSRLFDRFIFSTMKHLVIFSCKPKNSIAIRKHLGEIIKVKVYSEILTGTNINKHKCTNQNSLQILTYKIFVIPVEVNAYQNTWFWNVINDFSLEFKYMIDSLLTFLCQY